MNKTVSINLGGMFFHIDEDAYQKLNRYFDAIRRSLSPDGKDEIMSDIEARIAELLTEKLNSDKQVIGQREIDEVIAIMGKPEDYRIDEEGTPGAAGFEKGPFGATASDTFEYYRTKKFYRDGDTAVIAGVCGGLAHYFRVDPLWIRILFIITLIISAGTTSIVYLLLWVLIPPAITTAEKLEMSGEPINISNIEKKVREEFAQVGEKFKNVDYDRLGNEVKTGFNRVGSGIGYMVKGFFKVIAKIIAVFLVVFAGLSLGGMLITFIITLFATTAIAPGWYPYAELLNATDAPLWMVGVCIFFAAGIPILGLFLLGLRMLSDNLKPVGSITFIVLFIFWIASICGCAYFGLQQSAQFSNEGKTVIKQELNMSPFDTLYVKFAYNSYYSKSVNEFDDFRPEQDSLGKEVLYSNDIKLYVLKAEGTTPYIQVENLASSINKPSAKEIAQNIKYNFKFEGNTLILDNYLLTESKNKWHHQKVEIYLYLPEGYYFKPDASVKEFDESDNDFFDLWFDNDTHIYQMGRDKVKCLNCVTDENGNPVEGGSEDSIPAPPDPVAPVTEDGNIQAENTNNKAKSLNEREREIELKEREIAIKEREKKLNNSN